MTLLFNDGRLLSYKEIKQLWPDIRQRALRQLLNRLTQIVSCTTPEKLWGDEIEFLVIKFLSEEKQVKILLRAEDARRKLLCGPTENHFALWMAEVSCFQAETSPCKPYGGATLNSILDLSANIHARRQEFRQVLNTNEGEEIVFMSLFPLNGAPKYTYPSSITDKDTTNFAYPSIFYPHQVAVSIEPVMQLVVRNFQDRRGAQTCFYAPLFRDLKTPTSLVEDLSEYKNQDAELLQRTIDKLKPNQILIDTPGFGLSACSMQLTQQATNLRQATYLYDQLAVLCPIMMAVTAASPIVRGFMSNWDNRWLNFCNSWDDRTPEERGEVVGTPDDQTVNAHRIFSIETYTSEDSEPFNDVPVRFDPEIYSTLRDNGVDHVFARYVAHLMIHNPTSLSDQAWKTETDQTFGLFTTVQDFTNWSIMRLKSPSLADEDLTTVNAGFRVEFRVMDLQPTSFENVAFLTFVRLISLALLHSKLDLRIPVSKLFDNVMRSVEIDACRSGTFHWRTTTKSLTEQQNSGVETKPMAIQQIFIGQEDGGFVGLIPLVRKYVKLHDPTLRQETRELIERCLKFVEDKVTGKSLTTAQWVRKFVDQHPDYRHDSAIPQSVAYDLLRTWQKRANTDDEIE